MQLKKTKTHASVSIFEMTCLFKTTLNMVEYYDYLRKSKTHHRQNIPHSISSRWRVKSSKQIKEKRKNIPIETFTV